MSIRSYSNEQFEDKLLTVEVENLDGILLNNRVLVEVDEFLRSSVTTKTGLQLWIDPTDRVSDFAIRNGIIAKLPESLDKKEMTWDTEIEAKVGDAVWFYAMMGHVGEKLSYKGKKYILISYEDLYVSKRGNKVICLNGNVLLKQIQKTTKVVTVDVTHNDPNIAKIAYIGNVNINYDAEYTQDDKELKAGDTVLLSGVIIRHLERKPYLFFDGEEYLVCQNHEIKAKLV